MESDYIRIKTYSNHLDAEIVKGQLMDRGIQSMIRTDDCGGMMPNLQITEGVHLLVKRTDEEAAVNVLSAFNRESGVKSSSEEERWVCKNCGEILEPQFTDCWNCGSSREVGG